MHNRPARPRWSKTTETVRQLVRWAARRRRTATGLLLRGACYGAGTGAVSILAVWVERHL
ncbi:hypothetical protein ACFYXH_36355 [Streptomyces sp. NPDC002730]|uniref:hypothetical protein n=1 Tax=Streptomyces sp. NPDC002730 TaxID=3364662 RepID=UPI0036CD4E54